ncbi:hypothetical protein TEA_025050 [Camellia sinensis var. sinensis]|uniref:Uncharacterized protein n=1 Tax=Camellia sinensis var. sinensis TaxID=542762 RepID=A0A4V3WR16_CAMSN|nr:hypothetical protein TEA_025050 [Camellia sinensis var. sinensis]
MGRHGNDPTMVGSSIALLQERFKQLQRVREKREQQELLKLFSESKQITPTIGKVSVQPKMIFPLSPPPQDHPLSLRLNSPSKVSDIKAIENRSLTTLWSIDATIMSISPSTENSEVDTSLHL